MCVSCTQDAVILYCCDALRASVLVSVRLETASDHKTDTLKCATEIGRCFTKVPKKSVCCYLMMLSYQHALNIVPGPDGPVCKLKSPQRQI